MLERIEVAEILLLPREPLREPRNKRPADAIKSLGEIKIKIVFIIINNYMNTARLTFSAV